MRTEGRIPTAHNQGRRQGGLWVSGISGSTTHATPKWVVGPSPEPIWHSHEAFIRRLVEVIQFCRDVDLLKCEPVLFRELALASQTLCTGNDGGLSGTALTSDSVDFEGATVSAGHVVYVQDDDGLVDGCYEVVARTGATSLAVSVVRASDDDDAIAPPSGTGLRYRVSTFDAQAQEVSYGLLQYFGLEGHVGTGESDAWTVLNPEVLKQAAVYALLAAVFASSATRGDDEILWQKSLRYQRLFTTARLKARLALDVDNDGLAEREYSGGAVRLQRG